MEDRLATLKNVIKEPELDGWNLYLGNPLYLSASHSQQMRSSYFFLLVSFGFHVVHYFVKNSWGSKCYAGLFGAGDWGYNTRKEREEAATIPRIRILELSDFTKKLK